MSLVTALKSFSRSTRHYISENSPVILTALGITGFCTAIIVTAKQAPKAEEALNELEADIAYEAENTHQLPTKPQKLMMQVKTVASIYAPTALLAATSTACIIGGYNVNARRTAALATAYELSETARREYMDAVKRKLGEKGEQEIKDEYYREKSQKDIPQSPEDTSIICTGHGDQLFYDQGTGRFFRASVNYLEKVRVNLSGQIFLNTYASQNELAYMLNMNATTLGNIAGWSDRDLDRTSKLIDMRWDRCYMTDWGEAYAVLEYDVNERYRD